MTIVTYNEAYRLSYHDIYNYAKTYIIDIINNVEKYFEKIFKILNTVKNLIQIQV